MFHLGSRRRSLRKCPAIWSGWVRTKATRSNPASRSLWSTLLRSSNNFKRPRRTIGSNSWPFSGCIMPGRPTRKLSPNKMSTWQNRPPRLPAISATGVVPSWNTRKCPRHFQEQSPPALRIRAPWSNQPAGRPRRLRRCSRWWISVPSASISAFPRKRRWKQNRAPRPLWASVKFRGKSSIPRLHGPPRPSIPRPAHCWWSSICRIRLTTWGPACSSLRVSS